MNSKFFYAFIFLCASGIVSYGQNKKDIKKYKIKSITETVSITENNKTITYKEYYTLFDKNGKIIEETEFNADGSIKKKETTKYDNNDNKTEETCFHEKEHLKNNAPLKESENTKTIYKYNSNNDKTEENEYDVGNGKLIRKQVNSYNNKGEKTQEETFDATNKSIKKIMYSYDKGLKTEKKVYNKDNSLEETKKYTYTF